MGFHDGKFILLTNFCNTQINNANEYQIAKMLIETIGKTKDLSLEKISDDACISQASVSRFIKKAGFTSFQQFKEVCLRGVPEITYHRQMFQLSHFQNKDDFMISDEIFNDIIENLYATRNNLDLVKIKDILKRMKLSNSVSFYGDDHTLSQFFTLQIDLLANGIPSYLFKKEEIQYLHSQTLKKGDVVIFLNVASDFISDQQRLMIKYLKEKGVQLILFNQDKDTEMCKYFDIVYSYGKGKTFNFGFYSLQYLSQIISELFYRV